ncbi:MAG: metal ABC transporter permease, partial [Chloroflexota bacterium]|nr:metal ABC transporter permease [Chloroflexota bacterium]
RAPLPLLIGAGIAGWIGTLLLLNTVRETKLSEDTMLGVVLSTFYGLGIVLLTFIQRRNDASQAGLDKFLFGQAAALVRSNVVTFAVLGGIALLCVLLLYKEFKVLSFDPEFAASIGFPTRGLNVALTSLLVVAVMIGLQTVGVVLMAAMVIGPGTAARQWTDRLSVMLVLSACIGAAAGVIGAVISVQDSALPTGPMIILTLTVMVVFSILFAPRHGLLPEWWRRRQQRQQLAAPPLPGEPLRSGGPS